MHPTGNLKLKRRYWYSLFVLGILVVLIWLAVFSLKPDYHLRVNFYDVGQGDAIFVTTAFGTQVLIDGGPDSTVLRKLGQDMPFYDRTIDLVILSHPHADHVSGLVEVLRRYRVKKVIITEVAYHSAVYREFLEALAHKKIDKIIARAGQTVRLDKATKLQIFQPFEPLAGKTASDLNETSIVSKLSFGEIDFLFTGDASKKNESELFEQNWPLQAEVLKIAHQGSKTSTSESFLKSVNPAYTVIFVGENNRYGHPHEETINLLEVFGAKNFRTDRDGDIRFRSDGQNLHLH